MKCEHVQFTYRVYFEKWSYRWVMKAFLSFFDILEQSFAFNTSTKSGRKLLGSSIFEGHGSLAFNTTLPGLGLTASDFLGKRREQFSIISFTQLQLHLDPIAYVISDKKKSMFRLS